MRRWSLQMLLLLLSLWIPVQSWAVSTSDLAQLKDNLSPDIKGCMFFVKGLNLLHKSGFLKDALHELTQRDHLSQFLREQDDPSLFWQQGMQPFLDEMTFLYALTRTSVSERWLKWALWYGFEDDGRRPERSLYRREKLISDKQLIERLDDIEEHLIRAIWLNGHCASSQIRAMYLRWVHGEMYPVWRRIGLYLFSQDFLDDADTVQRMRDVLEALVANKDLPEVSRRPLAPDDVQTFRDRVVGIIESYQKEHETRRLK
jgi:hypothetical protein